jgi:23S rRNA pseudouridine955/2504/2580 synthase
MYINDEFFPEKDTPNRFLAAPAELNILYEDENLLLVDKKPGLWCMRTITRASIP